LCGTIIMFASIRLRHLALYSFRDRQNLVFKRDIIYSVIILPYVIILFNILNLNGIVYAYFLSAITSYIVYNRSYD